MNAGDLRKTEEDGAGLAQEEQGGERVDQDFDE